MRPQSWKGPFGRAEVGPVGRRERISMAEVRRMRREGVSSAVKLERREWVTEEGGWA